MDQIIEIVREFDIIKDEVSSNMQRFIIKYNVYLFKYINAKLRSMFPDKLYPNKRVCILSMIKGPMYIIVNLNSKTLFNFDKFTIGSSQKQIYYTKNTKLWEKVFNILSVANPRNNGFYRKNDEIQDDNFELYYKDNTLNKIENLSNSKQLIQLENRIRENELKSPRYKPKIKFNNINLFPLLIVVIPFLFLIMLRMIL